MGRRRLRGPVGAGEFEDEDGIPDIGGDEDDDGPEAKRQRLGSEANVGEGQGAVEEEGPAESSAKRARTGTLGVAWADVEFEEDKMDESEMDGSGKVICVAARCDHCDRMFESRNALFRHLRTVGVVPERQSSTSRVSGEAKTSASPGTPRAPGFGDSNHDVHDSAQAGSGADGLAATDEVPRGTYHLQDAVRQPHSET